MRVILGQPVSWMVIAAMLVCILSGRSDSHPIKSAELPEDVRYPRQIHLSLASSPDAMTVTWTTFQKTVGYVNYAVNISSMPSNVVPARTSLFVDGGSEKRELYIHSAVMSDLKPSTQYYYRVGNDDGGWSAIFFFTSPHPSSDWSPVLAVYGDMGNENARSLGRLQNEAQLGSINSVLHVGDFAYNMEYDGGRVGDQFMDQIQSIAAYIPYMTSVGNHESAYNFSHYRNRFTMPGGDGEGLWYSFDYGPAHIVAISTEVYFFTNQGRRLITEQLLWLKEDFKKANTNRKERPWLIVHGHRPMYCSNNDGDDCSYFESLMRYAMEDMFYEAGVDVYIAAHEHSYERAWPIYDRRICNGSYDNPYTEPTAPVHIITGSAGMSAGHDPFRPTQPFWSAYRTLNYGYSRFHINNSTHVLIEWVDDELDGKVTDSIWLIKSKHGANTYTCHKAYMNKRY